MASHLDQQRGTEIDRYLEYLYENKVIPSYLRMDRDTENGVIATMHAFLRQHHSDMDPAETVIYGPSTANQVSRNFVSGNSKLVHIINIPDKP